MRSGGIRARRGGTAGRGSGGTGCGTGSGHGTSGDTGGSRSAAGSRGRAGVRRVSTGRIARRDAAAPGLVLGSMLARVRVLLGVDRPVRPRRLPVPGGSLPGGLRPLGIRPVVRGGAGPRPRDGPVAPVAAIAPVAAPGSLVPGSLVPSCRLVRRGGRGTRTCSRPTTRRGPPTGPRSTARRRASSRTRRRPGGSAVHPLTGSSRARHEHLVRTLDGDEPGRRRAAGRIGVVQLGQAPVGALHLFARRPRGQSEQPVGVTGEVHRVAPVIGARFSRPARRPARARSRRQIRPPGARAGRARQVDGSARVHGAAAPR